MTLFPCYAYKSYAHIPVYAVTCSTTQVGQAAAFMDVDTPVTIKSSVCKATGGVGGIEPAYMKINVNFPLYATSVLCFMGWLILAFFLPTGMWGIPFDWIGAWAQRPVTMDEASFKRTKDELADKV